MPWVRLDEAAAQVVRGVRERLEKKGGGEHEAQAPTVYPQPEGKGGLAGRIRQAPAGSRARGKARVW